MVHLPAHAVLGDDSASARGLERGGVLLLPELDQRPECRARMNERGLVAVSFIETVDDPNPVGLESLELRIEPLDLEGQMMKSLTTLGEEPLDEARGASALDELDLEAPDREVRPGEFRPLAVSDPLRLVQPSRKILEEEVERLIDRADGDRYVVDAQIGNARRGHRANARGGTGSSQFEVRRLTSAKASDAVGSANEPRSSASRAGPRKEPRATSGRSRER